jgi:hypothetical protein
MPRLLSNNKLINKNINNKTMKREFVFPLVVGIIAGVLVMVLWQFNARLDNIAAGVTQLDQATSQNSKTVSDIVTFINNATGANKNAATGAAATGAAETTPAK